MVEKIKMENKVRANNYLEGLRKKVVSSGHINKERLREYRHAVVYYTIEGVDIRPHDALSEAYTEIIQRKSLFREVITWEE